MARRHGERAAASSIATRSPRSSAPIAGLRALPRGCARSRARRVPQPIIVVNAGTAVTIDSVDADGVFRGGIILPNMRLMLRALAENTAALKVPPGRFDEFPTNTADALYTGALHAVCGAIELARARAFAARTCRCVATSPAARRRRSPRISRRRWSSWIICVLEGVMAIAARCVERAAASTDATAFMRIVVILLLLAKSRCSR